MDKDFVRFVMSAAAGAALAASSIALVDRIVKLASRKRGMMLYHQFPHRSTRCAWLIAELDVESDFQIAAINLQGEERQIYQGEVHPHGTIPALIINGSPSMLESGSICLFIADLYSRLVPEISQRSEYYDWIVYTTGTVDSILEPLYQQYRQIQEPHRDQRLLKEKTKEFHIFANHLNSTLKGRDYVCGDGFTAADCVLGYSVWKASLIRDGELLEEYPFIKSYLARLKRRHAFQRTFYKDGM